MSDPDPVAASADQDRPARTPFAMFRVRVSAIHELSPSFRRFTFAGASLRHFADNGFDQRIKLFFPLPGVGLDPLPTGDDWYPRWRELPDDRRNPIRTYTIRAVRAESAEVDVDIALHGRVGVASAWACDAQVGDDVVVLGPDARFPGPHGGIDFLPPARTERYLVAGDETALPAIANILQRLPHDARGIAVVEVPDDADRAALPGAPAGVEIRVGGRRGRPNGAWLQAAVPQAAGELLVERRIEDAGELDDVDIDNGLLWEVPADQSGGPDREATPVYAWLAGEAGVIKGLRRHLVAERGIDRRSVAFMGYWRLGRAEQS